jgi:flagellin-like hook-associated protein FlgL
MGETLIINSGVGAVHDTTMLHEVTKKRETSEKLQMQIATQSKSNNFGEMGSETTSFINFEGEKASKEAFNEGLKLAISGFAGTQSTLESITKTAIEFRQLAAQVRDGSVEGMDVKALAGDTLKTLAGYLNTSINGQYIMAGSRSMQEPVDLSVLPDPNIYNLNATDDNSANSLLYYQGNSDVKHVRASSSQLKPIAATANQLPFQRLIRAAHILSTADTTDVNYNQKIAETVRLTDLSVDGLRSKSAEIGQTDQVITRSMKDNRDQVFSLNNRLREMNFADPIKVMTEFMAFNPQKQATAQALKMGLDSTEQFMYQMSRI